MTVCFLGEASPLRKPRKQKTGTQRAWGLEARRVSGSPRGPGSRRNHNQRRDAPLTEDMVRLVDGRVRGCR